MTLGDGSVALIPQVSNPDPHNLGAAKIRVAADGPGLGRVALSGAMAFLGVEAFVFGVGRRRVGGLLKIEFSDRSTHCCHAVQQRHGFGWLLALFLS